ncbi:SpoIIIAH-like family protein [Paenibacillus sp. GCM10012306]|uniref:SpoIIIAH-like family protein n=1 Tax=Paenibacillus sp. GCM10012306 TaxID=3317342 RepID=UPI0036158DB1
MNGKRQTIWLVSMLSLMVVLSAYYLFTEDSGASVPKETAGSMQVDGAAKGNSPNNALDKGFEVNEVVTQGDVTGDGGTTAQNAVQDPATLDDSTAATTGDSSKATDNKNNESVKSGASDKTADKSSATDINTDGNKSTADSKSGSDKSADKKTAAGEKTSAKKDADILDEVASQSVSASSFFNNYLYEREQKNVKQQRDLMAMINDMDKTPAENAVAQQQLSALEEKESKITAIEEQLQQKYGEAVVKEDSNNFYKVIVLSDKLDVKQAVGIVDLVMKELSVTQDKVSVQYISQQ